MYKLTELSKEELINLILNKFGDIGADERSVECAACGGDAKAKLYFICDECTGNPLSRITRMP